jgi:hypothetical protein
MSVMGGDFAFGPQSAKGSIATSYYRHRATMSGIGAVQDMRNLPLEIGGALNPTGAYKGGVFGGGGVELTARLQDVFGWLLYAAAGSASTMTGTPEAGMVRHVFVPVSQSADARWLTLRQKTPGVTTDIGEVILDSRLTALRIAASPRMPMTAQVGFMGREPSIDTNVGSWTYVNLYEDDTSVALANQGASITLNGASNKAVAVTIDLINQYTTPDEEAIIGSAYPDDFVLLSQSLMFTWTYKWSDPDLYRSILTGSASGTAWDPTIFYNEMEIALTSASNITGQTSPYRLSVKAPRVAWQAAGPPQLAAGRQLRQQYVGTAQMPTSGQYYHIALDNKVASYAWPSP